MSPSGIPQRPCTIVRKQFSCVLNPALNPWPVWWLITSPELNWGKKIRERCSCWPRLYQGHKWLGSNLFCFLPVNFYGCNNIKLVSGRWALVQFMLKCSEADEKNTFQTDNWAPNPVVLLKALAFNHALFLGALKKNDFVSQPESAITTGHWPMCQTSCDSIN